MYPPVNAPAKCRFHNMRDKPLSMLCTFNVLFFVLYCLCAPLHSIVHVLLFYSFYVPVCVALFTCVLCAPLLCIGFVRFLPCVVFVRLCVVLFSWCLYCIVLFTCASALYCSRDCLCVVLFTCAFVLYCLRAPLSCAFYLCVFCIFYVRFCIVLFSCAFALYC